MIYQRALEIGYSARNAHDHHQIFTTVPLARMQLVHGGDAAESRALEVQGLLAGRGHHRAPSILDLLVAAAAEVLALTVLHDDKDFELIAEITGQPTQRLPNLAPEGAGEMLTLSHVFASTWLAVRG